MLFLYLLLTVQTSSTRVNMHLSLSCLVLKEVSNWPSRYMLSLVLWLSVGMEGLQLAGFSIALSFFLLIFSAYP